MIFKFLIGYSTVSFVSVTLFKKTSLGLTFNNCTALSKKFPNCSDNSKSLGITFFYHFFGYLCAVDILIRKERFHCFLNLSITYYFLRLVYHNAPFFIYSLLQTLSCFLYILKLSCFSF